MFYQAFGESVKEGEHGVSILAPLVDTSTCQYQGKLHLSPPEASSTFCGVNKTLYQINTGDLEWVTQADPEEQLCKRCKNAAIEYLKKLGDSSA